MQPKKRRNRSPSPQWTYGSFNALQWRSSTELVTWAQTSPQFRDLLTVLINERERLCLPPPQTTENMQLGINVGVDRVIACLKELATGVEPRIVPEQEPTYEPIAFSESTND